MRISRRPILLRMMGVGQAATVAQSVPPPMVGPPDPNIQYNGSTGYSYNTVTGEYRGPGGDVTYLQPGLTNMGGSGVMDSSQTFGSASLPTGPMMLMGLGGLATVVGIAGAIFSDQYRKEFAVAAGVGILADFVGAAWFESYLSSTMQSQLQQFQQQQPA